VREREIATIVQMLCGNYGKTFHHLAPTDQNITVTDARPADRKLTWLFDKRGKPEPATLMTGRLFLSFGVREWTMRLSAGEYRDS
jgi:hypothetical protein